MKIPVLTALLLATAPLTTGCRSAGTASTQPEPIAVGIRMDGDSALLGKLQLRDPRLVAESTRTVAEFELVNSSSEDLRFAYDVEWFDARATRIEVLPQLWFPAELRPGASLHVRAPAPSPAAQSFRLIAQRPEALHR